MFEVLSDRRYARLFAAQVVALLGTGLLTVGLALAAYDIAGAQASVVLGMALTIKMIAYVGFSPVASALVSGLDRKKVLIAADLVRAAAALFLPFVDAVWQIYAVVFVLQAASATFTPAFQATIPDILPAEEDYTKALSLSRLAYDLENIISPVAAGLLLTVISFHWLFAGTALGFALSTVLVVITVFPRVKSVKGRSFADRLTRGSRIFAATPRLRGLFFLNLAAASIGAVIIVNTVVIVRYLYAGSQSDVAVALAAFGCGSMISALTLPRLLEHVHDRLVMITGAFAAVWIFLLNGWLCRFRGIALLVGAARGMAVRRGLLFGNPDAVRQIVAPLRAQRRQAVSVCGTIRAFPCLLAGDLSAVRAVVRGRRNGADTALARRACRDCNVHCSGAVAGRWHGNHRAQPRGPAGGPSASA